MDVHDWRFNIGRSLIASEDHTHPRCRINLVDYTAWGTYKAAAIRAEIAAQR